MECVRPPHADLEDYFSKRATRRVALDRTISLAGRLYEAPVPLIGKQIILLYHRSPHWRLPFFAKIRPGDQQLMSPNYRAFFILTRKPFGSDLTPKEIMQAAEVLGVAKRFEYASGQTLRIHHPPRRTDPGHRRCGPRESHRLALDRQ
ncbi:hypothetical protein DFAR_850027 [Desulfarculales bacterium]